MSTQSNPSLLFLWLPCLFFQRLAGATPRQVTTGLRPAGLRKKQTRPQLNRTVGGKLSLRHFALRLAFALAASTAVLAQASPDASSTAPAPSSLANTTAEKEDKKKDGAARDGNEHTDLLKELRQMRQVIERLEARVNQLEAEKSAAVTQPTTATMTAVAAAPVNAPSAVPTTQAQTGALSEVDHGVLDFWRGTTVNLMVDGYYGYNFNRPVGGVNLLRAYDVTSNSFNLNQATLVLEHAPDVAAGRRFGARVDLQYGQATETVQGNPANEPRPQVFRNLWQAYGTYVAPIGTGLTVDFGKFAGALGYETNFTKDNFNYSRAYFFNYLPFYHFGFRTSYSFNDKLTATHWLVNGANQSEDFNGFKSQAVLLTIKPASRVTLQTNYYAGKEQRDRYPALNPGFAPLPTQPGLSTEVIQPLPEGRFHVLDAYATFNVTDKLTLALEGDYVVNRVFKNSAPARVTGGTAYARYQFTPKFALAGRAEYLSDRGSLFSGMTQALKETTATAEYKFDEGMLLRAEWRRDFTNQPFFLTNTAGVLKKEQNTATLGLVWWWGRKQGGW
jgi:TolA-binding protein